MNTALPILPEGIWSVPATIVRVHDGDTVVCDLELGYHVTARWAVRINGCAAPELRVAGEPNQAGVASRAHAARLLHVGDEVRVVSHRLLGSFEKYGRVLASIYFSKGKGASKTFVDFAAVMIEAGHAKPWDGRGKQPT